MSASTRSWCPGPRTAVRRLVDRAGGPVPAGACVLEAVELFGSPPGIARLIDVSAIGVALFDIPGPASTGSDADLPDGLGQGGQFVIFGKRSREPALTAEHLPPARHRDAARMLVTQIPRMRLVGGGQRPDHRGRLRIHEGQSRHRGLGAARPAALSGKLHVSRLSRHHAEGCGDTRPPIPETDH